MSLLYRRNCQSWVLVYKIVKCLISLKILLWQIHICKTLEYALGLLKMTVCDKVINFSLVAGRNEEIDLPINTLFNRLLKPYSILKG